MEIKRSSFSVHDKDFNVMSVDLKNCLYIWIGDETQAFTELHGGFPLSGIKGEDSVVTTMMGDIDATSGDLAKMFAKKFGRAVFVSANLGDNDMETLSVFQDILFSTVLKMHPT